MKNYECFAHVINNSYKDVIMKFIVCASSMDEADKKACEILENDDRVISYNECEYFEA